MSEISVHVYPTDCDSFGHVNHATMITLFEHARWALLEARLPLSAMRAAGVWPVVRHVDVGYLAQALPGDDLIIRSGLVAIGSTSFTVRQHVRRARDGAAVAEGTIVLVCVGAAGRPVPVPDDWRDSFPRWEADA